MSQTALDDDELFGEAASEMQADVENSLDNAWSALPDADDVWEIDSDAGNTLGVLNGLKTGLDVGDATEHLKEAKKWFTMGQRADAFDDADDLADEIAEVESLIADVRAAHETVEDVTKTLPQIRGDLQETAGDAE
jgi:hypothetical protein